MDLVENYDKTEVSRKINIPHVYFKNYFDFIFYFVPKKKNVKKFKRDIQYNKIK